MLTPHKILEIKNRVKEGDKVISYSQMSMFHKCPHSWKVRYIDKFRPADASINLTFGTAFHETLQYYIEQYFLLTVSESNEIDLEKKFLEVLYSNYEKDLSNNNGIHFSTLKELNEYYKDGCAILTWIQRNISDYINKKEQYFVGTEIPIYYNIQSNLFFTGFIDQCIGYINSDKLLVYDYKTSKNGWGSYDKADMFKTMQLVLYKYFILKEIGYDLRAKEKLITPEYFIVRKKLIDDSEFLQKRVQLFKPPSGIVTLNRTKKFLDDFVEHCFKPNSSEYNLDTNYTPIAGNNGNNCKWCILKDNEDLCPKKLRI